MTGRIASIMVLNNALPFHKMYLSSNILPNKRRINAIQAYLLVSKGIITCKMCYNAFRKAQKRDKRHNIAF